MKLLQIPFSHNCVKVRRVLELKGIPFEMENIVPVDRSGVYAASGQGLVPVLVDGDRTVADSTVILLHLEDRYPEPPLLPRDAVARAECLLLEDWADAAFMKMSRRIAYWRTLQAPGALESLFFPGAKGLGRWIKGGLARRAVAKRFDLSEGRNRLDEKEAIRVSRIAVSRLGGRPYLVGDSLTLADVTLASMCIPLIAGAPVVTEDPSVRALTDWSAGVLGDEIMEMYRAIVPALPA